MTHLQIKALGKFQLQHEDIVVNHFPTHHVEELLGFLVLYPRVPHSRLKLIDLLWPESTEEQGRGRLNTAVWRIHTIFNTLHFAYENVLLTTRDWISFIPTPDTQMDFGLFQLYEHQAHLETESTQREKWLCLANSLYQGDFCEGIYADWCLLERERLARLHLRVLGQLMHCYLQRNAYEEAIEMGQRILQVDPLREEVHRALMLCYRHTGLYAQALRQFHLCARLLEAELKLMPMPETIALFSQITAEHNTGIQQKNDMPLVLTAELQEAVFQLQTASKNLAHLMSKYESTRPL